MNKPVSHAQYIILSSLFVWLLVPLLCQLVAIAVIIEVWEKTDFNVIVISIITAMGLTLCIIGYSYGVLVKNLPSDFLTRYLPFILPLLYTLLMWWLAMFMGGGDFSSRQFNSWAYNAILPFVEFRYLFMPCQYFTGLFIIVALYVSVIFFTGCLVPRGVESQCQRGVACVAVTGGSGRRHHLAGG